jgi:hypothetical protein
MSLATFKKKSVIQFGSNVSGKPTGAYWLPQGPFGSNKTINSVMLAAAKEQYGAVGFSLAGTHRNVGRVGQSMAMSKNGTPFRGVCALGSGGVGGRYSRENPTFNASPAYVEVMGSQYLYNKPPSLATSGMLRKKYKYLYNGQFPNYWVQPVYASGNLKDNASQGLYIHTKSAANDCHVDVNGTYKYIDYIKECCPVYAKLNIVPPHKYNTLTAIAPYTKHLYQPQTSSQHTLRVQRKCANPKPWQKPYPYAVNGNPGCGGPALNTGATIPEWYAAEKTVLPDDLTGTSLINSLADKITEEEYYALLKD